MRRLAMGIALILATACDGVAKDTGSTDTDTGDETDTSDTATTSPDGCPLGMQKAGSAEFYPLDLQVNGLAVAPQFDPNATYNGTPSACINPEGTAVQIITEAIDLPYAVINFANDTTGDFNILEDTGTFQIYLVGADPQLTYTNGDGTWLSGEWTVTSTGSTYAASINAAAQTNEGNALNVWVQVGASVGL